MSTNHRTYHGSHPYPKDNAQSIIAGDFDNHHSDWGYEDNDTPGEELSSWANQSDFILIYNPKDKGTFFSARQRKEHMPDLVYVT